jgi:DNA-binding NtrC family response regulator
LEHNPYAAPAANVGVRSGSAAALGEQAWFAVGTRKLLVMSLLSFGLYTIHWFERQYRFQKKLRGESTMPLARGIFSVFYANDLFRRIEAAAENAGAERDWTAGSMAGLFIASAVLNRIFARVSSKLTTGTVSSLLALASIVMICGFAYPLVRVQRTVNELLIRANPHYERNEGAPLSELSAPLGFGGLIGSSAAMQDVFALLQRVAQKPLTLLVEGETGTGKEEVAQAVHAASPRQGAPFVVLDCATIPPNLAESVLFGHERGAFTSAESRHIGAFERADHGTIFIDEIGELPLPLQPKLLRVLERRNLTRVGGKDSIPIDVRVITATHRALRAEIEAGTFREDLYFRLAQVRVHLPPLRARAADIPELARHFAGHLDSGAPVEFEQGAIEELSQRPFPGNVRELKNLVMRAAALCEDGVIRLADLSSGGFGYRAASSELVDGGAAFVIAKQRAVSRFERTYLEALLKRAGGNISRAAREADLARHHLRELLRKHGLYVPPDSEAPPPRQCADQDLPIDSTDEHEPDDSGRFRA